MFEITRFSDDDDIALYELTELFEGAFLRYSRPAHFKQQRLRFAEDLRRPGSFIARVEGRAVGFGTCQRLEPGDLVARLIRRWRSDEPDSVQLRRHHTGTDWGKKRRGALLFTAMAVSPLHRRQGIASALAQARIEHARGRGAPAVFVTCVRGAGTAQLYLGLGFDPILELAHHYPDGSGVTLVGLAL